MRLNFSTSWIFRGWITCFLLSLYAQDVASKSLQCGKNEYAKGNRCCNKCGPGHYVYQHCNDSRETMCSKCSRGEYQPDWTANSYCHKQKFCDEGKGFLKSVENHRAEEPCRCQPHLQCSPINCEFCEKMPTCGKGFGLEVDPEDANGRKKCVPCKKGFFSDNEEECRRWTSCKVEGRSETQPGGAEADAVCGPHVSVATPSWVIVSILSVITILCLLILLLFCFKDKLKLLSVNLRSCVQNLKRTRIQQETLTPLYQSGGPRCTPCETTKLIYQASHSSTDEPPCTTVPTFDADVKVSLPTEETTMKKETNGKTLTEDQCTGSGEPEEVSEEEDFASGSPLLAGSCVCDIPVCEPLEVGENEDCSQAVSQTSGTCSCGGLDGEKDGDKGGKEGRRENVKVDSGDQSQERGVGSKSETGGASLVSMSPTPFLHISSVVLPSSLAPEHCLPLSQVQTTPDFKSHVTDRPQAKQGQLDRLASTDSTSTEGSVTSGMTLVSPLMTSLSVGDLYLDKPPDASSHEKEQGLFWDDGSGRKISAGGSELECTPESLHSQLAEPTLTSGQVLGNHNTTFISSGQVMNFSGDVVVVYVSQTSHGSDGAGQGDTFGSPVQEEASETAPFFQNSLRSQGESISCNTVQDETLPVQEVMEERPVRK